MTDEQLNELQEEYGDVPDHLIPPVPSRKTLYSLRLWQDLVSDQTRLTGKLDLPGIGTLFNLIGIRDIKWQLKKMKMIFKELFPCENDKK